MFTKEAIALAKDSVEAIKKISKGKWEWKPEVGGWALRPSRHPQDNVGNIGIITQSYGRIIEFTPTDTTHKSITEALTGLIPILHWEKLEQILEGMGYYIKVSRLSCKICLPKPKDLDPDSLGYFLWNDEHQVRGEGDDRQEAVMQAVIELGKEE